MAIMLVISGGILACNIPVFQIALERWPAGAYPVTLALSAGPGGEERSMEEALLSSPANIALEVSRTGVAQPTISARYPEDHPQGGLPVWLLSPAAEGGHPAAQVSFWMRTLSAEAVRSMLDSPARRELSRRLLAGDSCVWILLESGEKNLDEQAAAMLENSLPGLSASIRLPEAGPGDPIMKSGPAKEAKFSVLRVSKDDAEEEFFVAMLLGIEPAAPAAEPLVYTVFGRARTLPPIRGKDLTAESIGSVAKFVCGPCLCQVKHQNPGKDLLVSTDWDAAFGVPSPKGMPQPPPMPDLIGLAPFATPTPETGERGIASPGADEARAEAPPAARSHLVRNVAAAVAALCLAVLGGTCLLRRKC